MKTIYLKIARIVALNNAHKIDGRPSLEDADRLYRWLTEYFNEKK